MTIQDKNLYFSIHPRRRSLCPFPISTTFLLPKVLTVLIFTVIILLKFLCSVYHLRVPLQTLQMRLAHFLMFSQLFQSIISFSIPLLLTLYPWKNLSPSPWETLQCGFCRPCSHNTVQHIPLFSMFPAVVQLYSEA